MQILMKVAKSYTGMEAHLVNVSIWYKSSPANSELLLALWAQGPSRAVDR